MEVTYRKNLSMSYMCIEEQGQLVEPYELQMLEGRSIPGLLELQIVISEGKRRYLYDISGKQQIGDYFCGKKIGHDILQLFLFSVRKVCEGLSDYLLREGGICLEMEFIYVNLADGSLQFTYLPFREKNLPEAFEACMEQFLRKLDHQDKAAVELGYHIYQLCEGGNANIGKLLETALEKPMLSAEGKLPEEAGNTVWERAAGGNSDRITGHEGIAKERKGVGTEKKGRKEKGKGLEKKAVETSGVLNLEGKKKAWQDKLEMGKLQAVEAVRRCLPGFSGMLTQMFGKISENRNQKKQKTSVFSLKHQKEHRRAKVSEGMLGEGEASEEREERIIVAENMDMPTHPTEILGVRQKEPLGSLTYQGAHQCGNILIEGESFLLGKNSEQADGVILAEGVSRLHARITRQGDKYFIEDLNSTNGTYLNDMALVYHQIQELKPGDRVRLGVEEYLFS